MKVYNTFPKVQALQDLAHLSTKMKMGNSNLHQINPKNLNPMHVQHNMVAPQGHAMAENQASDNPEEFLSKMKNAKLSRIKGIAF